MPFSGIFPFSEFLKSPLAKDLTFAGSSYKCVMLKDYADELNAENYRLFVHVTTATATLIAENSTVTIEGVDYYVTNKEETAYGSVRLFLTQAETDQEEPNLGPELLSASVANFTSGTLIAAGGATLAANLATFPAETGFNPSTVQHAGYVNLTEGEVYCLTVVIQTLTDGTLAITEQQDHNFAFFLRSEGTHKLYFTAGYYYMGYTKFAAINNTSPIVVTSWSIKKVTG